MLTSPMCGDPGRAMFHEYVGRYFANEPALKRADNDATCSICGAGAPPLWVNASDRTICQAQNGITSKRPGRKDASEPLDGPTPAKGMLSFSDNAMAIAGPHVARVVTKLLPTKPLPPHLVVRFATGRKLVEDEIVNLILTPPEPPFAVFVFGQKADYRSKITVDPSRIHINGPKAYAVDRNHVLELRAIFDGMPFKDLFKAILLRHRLATGDMQERDRDELTTLTGKYPVLVRNFRRLPSVDTPTFTALRPFIV